MEWHADDGSEPQLDDVTLEAGSNRWYLVVGVAEHRDSPKVWWLTLERVSERDAGDRTRAGARYWGHSRYRRDRRPR
jgi:hypothetical protein